jgi:hypothetical protein
LGRRVGQKKLIADLFYFHNPNMHYHYFTPRSLALLLKRCGFGSVTSYAMEAIDWRHSYRRAGSSLMRVALQVMGPLVAASRFKGRENLIAIANP